MLQLVCVLLTALLAGGDDKAGKADKSKDQGMLQGTWLMSTGEKDGAALPDDKVRSSSIVVKGDKMTVRQGSEVTEMTFKLDSEKKPKEIDVEINGQKGTGIYELENNILKIAHGEMGSPRPKEFPKKGESKGLTVITLRKLKPGLNVDQ